MVTLFFGKSQIIESSHRLLYQYCTKTVAQSNVASHRLYHASKPMLESIKAIILCSGSASHHRVFLTDDMCNGEDDAEHLYVVGERVQPYPEVGQATRS